MKSANASIARGLLQFSFVALVLCCMSTQDAQAQEKGPLLMKQELAYTLGGGVVGVGAGVLVWFMDPLNPNATLRNAIKDGFIVGTTLGALFGFYLLNNSINFPQESAPIQEFDELLGMEGTKGGRGLRNRRPKLSDGWTLPLLQIRF